MLEGKVVDSGELVASTDDESESDSDDDLVHYESNTSLSDSNSSDGELDEAESPVQQTTRSGRKTGHWSTRYSDFVI